MHPGLDPGEVVAELSNGGRFHVILILSHKEGLSRIIRSDDNRMAGRGCEGSSLIAQGGLIR